MKNMVVNEVCRMPIATISTIVLSTNKTILSRHLFNENGKGLELLKGGKLDQTLLKFILCAPLAYAN
jgi:hypothetical protein